MEENPYQAPEEDQHEEQRDASQPALGNIFWQTCTFMAAFGFLLFSYDQESWPMRIGSGIAVALAFWSFAEMAKRAYGEPKQESESGLSDDERRDQF